MAALRFRAQSDMPANADTLFAWHEREGAFRRLAPPWTAIRPVSMPQGLNNGDRAVFKVKLGPLWKTWVAEHTDVVPGRQFRDTQLKGPFAHWTHVHRFEPVTDSTSQLDDQIEFAPPGWALGRLLTKGFFHRDLTRMFAHRHRTTRLDLEQHAQAQLPKQQVLLSGASGLIGSNLHAFLSTGGHDVRRLVRPSAKPGARDVAWDPASGALDIAQDEPVDTVIHLAGAPVAGGRWNAKRKAAIRDSRVGPTHALATALAARTTPPKTLIIASAIGVYGDRGDTLLDEDADLGDGFLASVCRDWEAAAAPARDAGIRVVHLRIGVVLHPQGGALAKLVPPFKLAVGGRVGSGKQWWSWVSLDDVLGTVLYTMAHASISGPINVTAPNPVTNRDFTRALAKAVRRPAILPLPAFAARLALGEMANEVLLASQRVMPQRLLDHGYGFRDDALLSTLQRLLGRTMTAHSEADPA